MKFMCIAVLLTELSTSAIAQGLPTRKVLTIDVALAIAQEAMAKCRADGYKATVTVVDSGNAVKVVLRDDGASLGTMELGRLKAGTAAIFGRPSGPPANLPPGVPVPPPLLPNTTTAPGGVPIKVGGEVIGAVSVAGAPTGAQDTACVNAGLAKVADKLQ